MFLTAAPGADVVDEVQTFRNSIDDSQATWIYAGKAAAAARHSTQIGEKSWDACVLLQYPSRGACERHAQSAQMRQALERFADHYIQGFQRWGLASAAVPLLLLLLRGAQVMGRRPSHFPFRRARDRDTVLPAEQIATRLRAESELGSHGIVIVNLVKNGTREQQRANRRYAIGMFGAMAEGGYGPMHLGRAVQVEKDYNFDTVALVYYPGVEFFISLAQSDYFQSIVGDKQVADTQAVITVPVASGLQNRRTGTQTRGRS